MKKTTLGPNATSAAAKSSKNNSASTSSSSAEDNYRSTEDKFRDIPAMTQSAAKFETIYRSVEVETMQSARLNPLMAQGYPMTGLQAPKTQKGQTGVVQFHNMVMVDDSSTSKMKQARAQQQASPAKPATTTSSSSSSGVATTTLPQVRSTAITPMPMPFIVGENTTAYILGPIELACQNIDESLTLMDVDLKFKPEKCKWTGKAYCKNRELIIRGFLFTIPKTSSSSSVDVYLMEMQRKKGCAVHFAFLYQRLYEDLVKRGVLCTKDGRKIRPIDAEAKSPLQSSRQSFDPLPLPIGFGQEEDDDDELTIDAFDPLIDMCQSEYLENQQEGFREIANQVQREQARKILATSDNIFNILVTGITCSDADVRRCAASALEWFSREKAFAQKIHQAGGVQRICQLLAAARTENIDRETRRTMVRAAANLAQDYRQTIQDCLAAPVFKDLATHSSDPTIRVAAQAVLSFVVESR